MIRKGYVDTPGGQIHYLEAGTGRPIVFLNQTSDAATGRRWASLWRHRGRLVRSGMADAFRPPAGCCQSNGNSSQERLVNDAPSGSQLAPFCERSGTVLLVNIPAVEMTFVVEVIVDRGVC